MAPKAERPEDLVPLEVTAPPAFAASRAEPPPTPTAAAAPVKPEPPPVLVIAPGHSITTARGYLHAGEVVTERDFPQGKKQLETLVASKAVVERK